MRVGWLYDAADHPGGAELTQAEFRTAAPESVEVVDCRPGAIVADLDRYVLHNVVTYSLQDMQAITWPRPTLKYWHDVGPWMMPEVAAWIDRHAVNVFCSPVQAEYMGKAGECIPPPVDLDRFARAAEGVNGDRAGNVSVGSWRNLGKSAHKVAEWAQHNGGVDFYGGGPFAPPGSAEVSYDAMPSLLAQYERFVFLPSVIEPFGRLVAEAWAAGCEVVTNELVGAGYWIKERPEAIETAAEDFWKAVLA